MQQQECLDKIMQLNCIQQHEKEFLEQAMKNLQFDEVMLDKCLKSLDYDIKFEFINKLYNKLSRQHITTAGNVTLKHARQCHIVRKMLHQIMDELENTISALQDEIQCLSQYDKKTYTAEMREELNKLEDIHITYALPYEDEDKDIVFKYATQFVEFRNKVRHMKGDIKIIYGRHQTLIEDAKNNFSKYVNPNNAKTCFYSYYCRHKQLINNIENYMNESISTDDADKIIKQFKQYEVELPLYMGMQKINIVDIFNSVTNIDSVKSFVKDDIKIKRHITNVGVKMRKKYENIISI